MGHKKRSCGLSRTSIIRRRKALLSAAAKDKTPVPDEIIAMLRKIMHDGYQSLETKDQAELADARRASAKINLLARQALLHYTLFKIKKHQCRKG